MPGTHLMDRRQTMTLLGSTAAATLLRDQAAAPSSVRNIFDAHLHIMINDPAHYPFSDGYPTLNRDISKILPTTEVYVAMVKEQGVTHAALVQHDPVYGDDNGYIADTVRKYPQRLFAVGRLSPGDADAVNLMRSWIKRGLSGLRVSGAGGRGATGMIGGAKWIEQPAAIRVWKAAAELQTPLLLLLSEGNRDEGLASIRNVMKRVPKLQLILDHMRDFNGRDENKPTAVAPKLLNAASIPNVYVKVSRHNLRRLALNNGSPSAAMKKLVSAFGAQRIIWDSDLGNTPVVYADMIVMAKNALAELAAADQQMIMSGTAKRLYRVT